MVIDGGSSEPTLRILDAYRDRITTLVSEPDSGIYDAMNKGIQRATGDVVGILNADDCYQGASVLSDVAEAFLSDNVEASYGDLVYVDRIDRVMRLWKSGKHARWKWYLGWMPPHPTFFVRRRVYQRYGLFDTNLRISADYELMLRFLLKYRIQVHYLTTVMVRMGYGGNSNKSVKNILNGNLEVLKAWHQNGLAFGYLAPILKPTQKIFQFARARAA